MSASRNALGLWALQLINIAAGYVVPPLFRVPVPQLHYSKAQEFQAGNERILNVSQNSAQAYALKSTYDHTNWMSQFNVEAV